MLKSHSLQVQLSETREKINSALDKETLEDAERAELDGLRKRAQEIEIELRAAMVAEGTEAESRINSGDAEGRELRGLLDDVSISEYLAPATGGMPIEGRARELNEALKLPLFGGAGGVSIPWALLESRERRDAIAAMDHALETRAFTTTGAYAGGIGQRPILQRLFGPGIMDALVLQRRLR